MISMWRVASLAASRVTVCLGGQAADELFAGYARYAVTRPFRVVAAEAKRRLSLWGQDQAAGSTLQKQLGKGDNAARLLRLIGSMQGWERRYFNTIAQFSQPFLASLFPDATDIYTRDRHFTTFRTVTEQCASRDPMDRAMYWDRMVYLPGLFTQDDRMSMAHSLETRVPLADPRLARLALRIPAHLKMNGFSTKWILKKALRGVVPDWVIDRRKAGFDTPARLWFTGSANELTRDLLAGSRTRGRGLFDTSASARLLDHVTPQVEILIWKLINVEQWFRTFVDGDGAQWQKLGNA